MRKLFKSTFTVQVAIFIGLFILLEIILRCFGWKAGTIIDDFIVEKQPTYEPRFWSDEEGINHILADSKQLMNGTVINSQGFRGRFDYTHQTVDSIRRHTKKEIVMIIGDSYVEGCCADTVTNSFPDILDRSGQYAVLNFGVAVADPLQYELIAKKYVPALKPDRVLVVIYFGNDMMDADRKPSPGVPITYPFKKNKWLHSIATDHLSGEVNHLFRSPGEAYDFYVNHYTLEGKNRNFIEKGLGLSVILSKLYLLFEFKISQWHWGKIYVKPIMTAEQFACLRLMGIIRACNSAGVPCLFAGIPEPKESTGNLKKRYQPTFKELSWEIPGNLTLDDYDGPEISSHFNNQGHRKYALFLKDLLDRQKKVAISPPAKNF